MKIEADDGTLFINQRHFCRCEAGNGRDDLPNGKFPVTIGTAFHLDGNPVLPYADGLGWLGHFPGCDLVLGSVRGRNALLPSQTCTSGLLHQLERAEQDGQSATLVIDQ